MKPYSKDLRSRVLAAVDRRHRQGRGGEDLLCVGADHQALAPAAPETGDLEPRPIPGRPRVKGAALEGWLPSHLRRNPDLTLEEHREAFEEAHEGTTVSASTVGRAIARLPGGWPLKKSPE
jgi:transposase